MTDTKSIAIIADTPSLYVRYLIEDLLQRESAPRWVFIGSTTEHRFFVYQSFLRILRRHGWREVIWRVMDRTHAEDSRSPVDPQGLECLQLRTGFEVVRYDHIDSGQMLLDLMQRDPALVLLAGCGIVSSALLGIASLGVLNGHPAMLPGVRGVDVIDWSILYDAPTGVTAHFAAPNVDAGDIVAQRRVEPEPGESWINFKDRIVRNQADCLAEAAVQVLAGRTRCKANDISRSRLCFATRRSDRRMAEARFSQLMQTSSRQVMHVTHPE